MDANRVEEPGLNEAEGTLHYCETCREFGGNQKLATHVAQHPRRMKANGTRNMYLCQRHAKLRNQTVQPQYQAKEIGHA